MVIEAVVAIALIAVGAVTLTTEKCGVSQISFNLNTWVLVTGCVGLFYALYVFIVMGAFLCVCLICCIVPAFWITLFAKSLFCVVWAIVGIIMLALGGPHFITDCPVAFAFAIVGVVALLLDVYPTYKFTTVENQ